MLIDRFGIEVMATLIFGARGFLGQHFLRAIDDAVGSAVDIADAEQVAKELDRCSPSVVINCAGKTGKPNVDWCESHKDATLRSNVTGALVVLHECSKRGVHLVHVSSGCLYSGDNGGKGFNEEDTPNFCGSYYVRTKIASDRLLSEFPVLILRPRMLFDDSLHPRSLISKLVKYRRILDEPNSLTYVPDLIEAAVGLISQRMTGIFHTVNPGVLSPLQIMTRYREIIDPSHSFEPLAKSDLGQVTTTGRSNCVLSSAKLAKCGVPMRPVKDALDAALMSIQRRLRENP